VSQVRYRATPAPAKPTVAELMTDSRATTFTGGVLQPCQRLPALVPQLRWWHAWRAVDRRWRYATTTTPATTRPARHRLRSRSTATP